MLFYILFLTFMTVSANAQTVIDSLWTVKTKIENAEVFDENKYSETVNSLIYCYNQQSDFYIAQQVIKNGINVLLQRGSSDNTLYWRTLNAYSGLIDYNLKNYNSAIEKFKETISMCENADDVSDEYFVLFMNLSNCYAAKGNYLEMKNCMDTAVKKYEQNYGSIFQIRDERFFLLLNNYGYANHCLKNYKLAEQCYKYVIDNCQGTFESNNALPLALNNYAMLLAAQFRYNDAFTLLARAKTMNTEYAYIFAQNFTTIFFAKCNRKRANEALQLFNGFAIDNTARIFSDFPKSERENYWTTISWEILILNNLVTYFDQKPEELKNAYNMSLFCRNLLLNSDDIIEKYIKNSVDDVLKSDYYELKNLKQKFIFNADSSLKSKIEQYEESVIHRISNLSDLLKNNTKTWEDEIGRAHV